MGFLILFHWKARRQDFMPINVKTVNLYATFQKVKEFLICAAIRVVLL